MSAEAMETGPSASRTGSVYEWIRERIIDGTYPPGQRIRERDVALELEVSRVPVREALPQLESEGYIETLPRRGAVVTHLTVQGVTELFDVRASLEVLAARLAAEACAAGADAERLTGLLADAGKALMKGDEGLIADLNAQIHEDILELSGSRLLKRLMSPVNGQLRRLFHVAADRDQAVQHDEHSTIVQAILGGHAELAAALAFAHVEHSRNECLPIVEKSLK
ncbi:GntR family transcriptional regulator [Arthrobacter celericrescens]|uniref:GntR family transcriptional regulator n=1 Tax=Arthrobacter celericrescens TaxID=2320851 RepID=UPI000EA3F226|nr:GntR family transcriptional regulator [Arthrobacter celericrescens]